MRLMACVAILAVAAGCDVVFSLEAPAEGTCEPIAYDAHRYWSPEGRSWGLSWSGMQFGAREECATRAMDLAVLNEGDAAELANQAAGAMAPFWLGVSFAGEWTAVDGCTPALQWAAGEPATAVIGQCVVMTAAGMAVRPCGHVPMQESEYIQALCETPRPDGRCRKLESESDYELGSTSPVKHVEAVAACADKGMQLVELGSSTEIMRVRAQLPSVTTPFWLGTTFDGERWISPTGCPQVFEWLVNEPSLTAGACALHDVQGVTMSTCEATAAVICERS